MDLHCYPFMIKFTACCIVSSVRTRPSSGAIEHAVFHVKRANFSYQFRDWHQASYTPVTACSTTTWCRCVCCSAIPDCWRCRGEPPRFHYQTYDHCIYDAGMNDVRMSACKGLGRFFASALKHLSGDWLPAPTTTAAHLCRSCVCLWNAHKTLRTASFLCTY
jgi:hypothetical protein